jgi:hypothetical protein
MAVSRTIAACHVSAGWISLYERDVLCGSVSEAPRLDDAAFRRQKLEGKSNADEHVFT